MILVYVWDVSGALTIIRAESTLAVVEMMAAAGVDFVITDMEHTALDLDRCAHFIRAADAAGIKPDVRRA